MHVLHPDKAWGNQTALQSMLSTVYTLSQILCPLCVCKTSHSRSCHTYCWACNSSSYFELNISLLARIALSILLTLYFTKEQVLTKIKKLAKRFKKISYTSSAFMFLFIFFSLSNIYTFLSYHPTFCIFILLLKWNRVQSHRLETGLIFFPLTSGCTFALFQVGEGKVLPHKLTA